MPFLTLDNLEKTYLDGTRAVKGIDLAVEEGEFIVLLGPSGCGKTTTLRMIAGLEIPTAGRITLAGQDVTTLRPAHRDVGFVFQFYALYPHLSVQENIAFPLKSVGVPKHQREQRIAEVAQQLGLERLLRLYPRQLSGGDQQRVSLARAMVRRPKLWLMDEPLGTLDADRRLEMREFIRAQQLAMKVTTIYVTHDQEEAMSLADRIVVMEAGVIRQVGGPATVYDRPADLFVANFVGSPGMNFIQGQAAGQNGSSRFQPRSGPAIPLQRDVPQGAATLGIRCEYVRPDPTGSIAGRVAVNEYFGSHRSVHVDCPFGRVIVRSEPGEEFRVGDEVRLRLDEGHVNFFSADGGRRIG